jgi:chemotaxis protein MotB
MVIPSIIWSAGYQEQQLFNTDFYSSKDLKKKIKHYNKEIIVFGDQIKALQTDIDWLILKTNQIQDSGRRISSKLKDAISKKQKKREALLKSKNRLERLVQYYASIKGTVKKDVKIKTKDIVSRTSSYKDKNINKAKLQTAIHQAGLNDWVEIVGTDTCLTIKTTLPILFPSGSAKLANEYTSFFKKLAGFLKRYDVKILVNGYADTRPIHNKKYPSNFELGATRAANIVHQLVNYGLKPSIFKIESTGRYRFAAKGISKQKSFERRAEVTVVFSG